MSTGVQYVKTMMIPGEGNRVNLHEIPTIALSERQKEKICEQTRSVAAILNESELEYEKGWFSNSYRLKSPLPLKQRRKAVVPIPGNGLVEFTYSDKDKLSNEIHAAFGTAFLIGKRLLVTAGHCVCNESPELDHAGIKNSRVVFGFEMKSEGNCTTSFKESDVYKIKRVVAHYNSPIMNKECNGQDWALLKLDREVTDRQPLEMDFFPEIRRGLAVYMIGHPLGVPAKLSLNGYIRWAEVDNIIGIELDMLKGNSGSPVFLKKTNKVIGIMVAGHPSPYMPDYEDLDADGKPKVFQRPLTEKEIVKDNRAHIVQRNSNLGFVIAYLKAKNGDRKAQIQLSKYYFKGVFVPYNPGKGIKIINRVASRYLWTLRYIPYSFNPEYGEACQQLQEQLQEINTLESKLLRAARQEEEELPSKRTIIDGVGSLSAFYKFWREENHSLHMYEALSKYTGIVLAKYGEDFRDYQGRRLIFIFPTPDNIDADPISHVSSTIHLLVEYIKKIKVSIMAKGWEIARLQRENATKNAEKQSDSCTLL